MSAHQLVEDACSIRDILELLETDPEPVTIRLVEFTQHVSRRTAQRLMKILADAGIVEHSTAEADIMGAKQKVPCLGWQLTPAAKQGRIPSAEELAGRIRMSAEEEQRLIKGSVVSHPIRSWADVLYLAYVLHFIGAEEC